MSDWPKSYTDPDEKLGVDDPWLQWAIEIVPGNPMDTDTLQQEVAKALRAAYWRGQGEGGSR